MKKGFCNTLVILSTAIVLFMPTSRAATTCIIDFSTQQGTESYCNTFSTFGGLNVIDNIVNTNGSPTNWSLSVSAGRGQLLLGPAIWSSPESQALLDDFASGLGLSGGLSQNIWRDGFNLNSVNAGSPFVISLSGLQANSTYEISFGFGRSTATNTFPLNVTSGKGTLLGNASYFDSTGATGSSNTVGSGKNDVQRISTFTITSNALGEIELYNDSSGNNVYYSVMQFMTVKGMSPIPETSTAMLGFLSLSVLLARRKRCS